MKSKIFKFIVIPFLIIAIPSLIIITVLYVDDKFLLHEFLKWIKEPGNLSAFIMSIGFYFPFINGIWKLGLNLAESINKAKTSKRNKKNKIKIYDDEKHNYIYYDPKENILDFQFKANENQDIDTLMKMSFIELKTKIEKYKNENKKK